MERLMKSALKILIFFILIILLTSPTLFAKKEAFGPAEQKTTKSTSSNLEQIDLVTQEQGMALITSEERAAIEQKWLTISTVNAPDTLYISMYSDFAPYTFINAGGQPAGLFVDIWNLWAEKTGKEIKFLPGSWQTSLDNLKKGTANSWCEIKRK